MLDSVADNGMATGDGGLGGVGIKTQCGHQKARTAREGTQGGEPNPKMKKEDGCGYHLVIEGDKTKGGTRKVGGDAGR